MIQTEFKQLQVKIGKEETILQKYQNEEYSTDNNPQNARLQVLRLDKEGIIPNFEKDIYQYYLTVTNEINDIEVLAIPENSNSTVEIIGNTNLIEGLNTISINVTSEDKTQSNTYSVQVTKTKNLELANTNLEILAIENILLYPQFEANVTNYKAKVSKEVTNLNILAIPENENAIVEIYGKDNLKQGNNVINIIVTAPDGFSKRLYVVNVYKRNEDEEKNYQEEQRINQEKLEEIYQMEKTNNESESETPNQEQKSKKQKIIVIVIVILVVILLVALYIWRKNIV